METLVTFALLPLEWLNPEEQLKRAVLYFVNFLPSLPMLAFYHSFEFETLPIRSFLRVGHHEFGYVRFS